MEDVLEFKPFKKVEHFFLTNEFNKCCPFYISIGMTYEQFWHGDPTMTKAYYRAYKLKEEREAEKMKWITWEQGLYVYEAICNVSPVLRAFSKATKPLPYPEKPHGLKEDEEKEKRLKEIEKERDMYRTQIFFQNWAKGMQEKFRERKEE